jgi:hypothetical protein
MEHYYFIVGYLFNFSLLIANVYPNDNNIAAIIFKVIIFILKRKMFPHFSVPENFLIGVKKINISFTSLHLK